jgi:hypothetical protein
VGLPGAQVHLFFGGGGDGRRFAGNRLATRRTQDIKRGLRRLLPPNRRPARWPRPRPPSPARGRAPSARRDAGSRRPEPKGRRSRRGPTLSEWRWSCVHCGALGAACFLRRGSRRSCSASARRPPPSRRMHPRAVGDRSPSQSPGRCRGLAVSHRLDVGRAPSARRSATRRKLVLWAHERIIEAVIRSKRCARVVPAGRK